ncbi:response regulator transcription factor [Paraburkholderia caballeronis]|uniref:DNA-binding response regulator, OmpR family, contains REC and winged-helix (WHTH) domain n=1 Tax=Paraburkholderia caballeronis TaxID=416943 RepID=A0A1H7QH56_9BURK|nr:response regulator transcription factor [Paraburkholderia caballeronis]PXW22559.1 winged helix family two component transcriptional regulator [Paraburkholderia caballeronis]PXW96430.1 winged helix family two component transcriptional regulator [Paraburkholderia caballeronis]RAJ92841.1 winged helix family two component transcriptional regulator [Paraburkholderia caballeronis]TDV34372.1 winged helix family two component transcriptional regulator [Paraburkholderia caballeronis]SEE06494.1 two c
MRIAILQRDLAQRNLIETTLTGCGHTCVPFDDCLMLANALAATAVDLLVLDWYGALPSDVELLTTLRARGGVTIPALFASADRSDESVLRAFSAGADDYVSLPVSPAVFGARVNALLRRAFPDRYRPAQLDAGPYHFDAQRQMVTLHGRQVLLSGTQYRLASLFFGNVGRVLSRDHIYAAVWGRELHTMTRTIDSHVSRLRTVLEIDVPNGFRLQPVYKNGYRLLRLDGDPQGGSHPPVPADVGCHRPQRRVAGVRRSRRLA